MPTLTVEAIRENPWNVISHRLPENREQLLLEAAHLAADYCRKSEYTLLLAARHGRYVPPGWEPSDDSPDIHEENEALCFEADRKLDEICWLHEKEFGLPIGQ